MIVGSFIAIGSFLIFSSNNLLYSRKFYENNESIEKKKEEGGKIMLDTFIDDVFEVKQQAQTEYKERAEQRERQMSLYGYNVL